MGELAYRVPASSESRPIVVATTEQRRRSHGFPAPGVVIVSGEPTGFEEDAGATLVGQPTPGDQAFQGHWVPPGHKAFQGPRSSGGQAVKGQWTSGDETAQQRRSE